MNLNCPTKMALIGLCTITSSFGCLLDASHHTYKTTTSTSTTTCRTMASRPVEQVLKLEDLTVADQPDEDVREQALKHELAGVQALNKVMEQVITAMSTAKTNMDVQRPQPQPQKPQFINHLSSATARMIPDGRRWEQRSKTRIDYSIYGSKS